MSVLDVLKSASLRLIGRSPQEFFSSSNTFEKEMADLANEVATDIARSHDWRILMREYRTPTNSSGNYSFPDDYDRMPVGQGLWGISNSSTLETFDRQNRYNGSSSYVFEDGVLVTNGQPGPIEYVYVSKNFARDDNGAPNDRFINDNSEFVLDNRLLVLGLIWRWREMKRLDSSGDMEQFQKAFSEKAARDAGGRVISTRNPGSRWLRPGRWGL